jgi:hypothetical protein
MLHTCRSFKPFYITSQELQSNTPEEMEANIETIAARLTEIASA